jgi:hypothetical protein
MTGVVGLLRSFFREKSLAQPAPSLPPAVRVSVPDDDHAEEVDLSSSAPPLPGSVELAEGQSFVIQYRDASGHESTRAISVWAIRYSKAGIPLLAARCHVRRATRYFRVDRIEAIADLDGVLIEPLSVFLRETFGIVWPPAEAPAIDSLNEDIAEKWSRMRRVCREGGIQLLCAVGLADGEITPDEMGEILDYAQRCCAQSKIEFSDRENSRLRQYVKNLRPTPESIDRALDRLLEGSPSAIASTISACVRVMEADGVLHPAEMKAVEHFTLALTGLPLQHTASAPR